MKFSKETEAELSKLTAIMRGLMWTFETPSQTDAQNRYAARLFARVDQTVMLRRADVAIGEWKPSGNECHGNVTELCAHDPSFTPARGWLYFDLGGHADRVQFLAHSAVKAPDGEVFDITPSRASQGYPFIAAEESDAEYAALIQSGVTRLWHIK